MGPGGQRSGAGARGGGAPWVVSWSPLKMQNTFDNLYLLAWLLCVINYQIEIAFDSPSAIFPRVPDSEAKLFGMRCEICVIGKQIPIA